MVTGDFNRDGWPDLAVSGNELGSLFLLFNRGDGQFQPPVTCPSVSNCTAMVTADFDRDGTLDLIVGTSLQTNLWLLLGVGDGTFQDPTSLVVGFAANQMVLGDFNGDEVPDVIAVGANATSLSLLLGHGDATFQAAQARELGFYIHRLEPVEVNNDGRLDLLISGSEYATERVYLLLGKGDGTFQTPAVLSFAEEYYDTPGWTTGDFNQDGNVDILATYSNHDRQFVFLGDGNGSFQPTPPRELGSHSWSVSRALDLNEDGRLDLVALDSRAYTLIVCLGNGDGSFQSLRDYPIGAYPDALVAADFDGDAKIDLAVANRDARSVVVLLRKDCNTPPFAVCTNVMLVTTNADAWASIDAGSFDLDVGDTITTFQTPPGPYPPGSNWVTLTATDNHGTSSTNGAAMVVRRLAQLPSLIPTGSVWKYLDDGSNQREAWREPDFDDSHWLSGPGQLGYGDSDIATFVQSNRTDGSRIFTFYFRHTFWLENPSLVTNLAVRLLRDDGGIVYLNGVEVFRSNMREGPVYYDTTAITGIPNADEDKYFPTPVLPALLTTGANVVAVEIHQCNVTSTDVSFDLELVANSPFGYVPPDLLSLMPTNGSVLHLGESIPLTANTDDPNRPGAQVEFYYQATNVLGTVTEPPFVLDWLDAPAGLGSIAAQARTEFTLGTALTNVVFVADRHTWVKFFPEFTSSSGLVLQTDAIVTDGRLRVSQSYSSTGGAWLDQRQPLADGFETVFQFQINEVYGDGADGFALVIEGHPSPTLGGGGGGLGYDGLTNSLAVEFDTYQAPDNGDPNNYHIGIHTRGPLANDQRESAAIARTSSVADFTDGKIHTVKISYVPGIMRVFLDRFDTPVISTGLNLTNTLYLPNGSAWVGFTASGGGWYENHDILRWAFTRPRRPSEVRLVFPRDGATFVAPASILLSAAADSLDGAIRRVELFANSTLLATVTNAPWLFRWTNVPSGRYQLMAVAIDDLDEKISSAPVTVTVNSHPVAQCHDVTVSAEAGCVANASVDEGSYDPDSGDTIVRVQAPPALIRSAPIW